METQVKSTFSSPEQKKSAMLFVIAAVKTLRKHNKVNPKTNEPYSGVHVRWSKFNDKFRKAFPTLDVIEAIKELEKDELVATVAGRGGPTLYLFADRPAGYRPAKDETAIDDEIASQLALLEADSILATDQQTERDALASNDS